MKTMRLDRDYSFRASRAVVVQYLAGNVYKRVPEIQARAIVAAGAGAIVEQDDQAS